MKKRVTRNLLLLFILNLVVMLSNGQFNGTYSIGSSKEFTSIQGAIDSLIEVGVSGPTIFEIDSGTYVEQLIIQNISGISENNNVTFKAKNDSVNDVIVSGSSSFTVTFNNADYITLKFITLKNEVNGVVLIKGGSDYVTLDNCTIIGANVTESKRAKDAISGDISSVDNYTSIINCKIKYGSCGIYLQSPNNGILEQGHRIENNSIEDAYVHDFGVLRANNVIVKNNIIQSDRLVRLNGCGIILNKTSNSTVENNIVIGTKHGIRIHDNNSSDSTLVMNNMFSSENGDLEHYPLYLTNGNNNLKIYNNSFYQLYTGSNGAVFSASSAGDKNIVLYNNNFVSKSPYSGIFESTPSAYTIDYNNFYDNSGSARIKMDNKWISVVDTSNQYIGNNNISIDPLFLSNSDLHVTNNALGNSGRSLTEVVVDIDGEARNVLTPDIGADEFDPFDSLDVAILKAELVRENTCSVPSAIKLSVKNSGYQSFNSIAIERTINGLALDSITTAISLESYQLGTITINYPEYKDGDTITLKVVSIDNAPDPLTENSSVTFNGIWLGMSGTISVSNSAEFDSVFLEVSKRGVCGTIDIQLLPGVYENRLRIGEVVGVGADAEIIIRSSTGNRDEVIIAPDNASNFVFDINGTDYLTIKDLTINADSINSYAIDINQVSEHCTFENLHLIGDVYGSQDVFRSSSHQDHNMIIRNCLIENGDYGIYMDGNNEEDSILIENNRLINPQYGIGCYHIKNLTIRDNYIQIDSSYNADGIVLEYIYGNLELTNNMVLIDSTTGAGAYLEYFYGVGAVNNLIAGNYFDIGGQPWAGIYFYEVPNTRFYNNTINITSNSSKDYALYLDYFSSLEILNNNIVARGKATAIYYDGYLSGVRAMDYNNIYSELLLVEAGNAYLKELTDWQETGHDQNSISVNPMESTSLRPCNTELNKKGTPVDGVPQYDAFNSKRDLSMPDLGAVEIGRNPGVFLGEDIVLCDSEYTLDAGDGGTSYLWSTGETTQSITITTEGMYSVSIEGSCNNESRDTIEVHSPEISAHFTPVEYSNTSVALINASTGYITDSYWDYEIGTSEEENIFVDFEQDGAYSIRLTVSNMCRSVAFDTTISIVTTTGVGIIDQTPTLKLYPNPVLNELTIELNDIDTDGSSDIEVFNSAGMPVVLKRAICADGKITINLEHLQAGIYFVKVKDQFSKIIKL